MKISEQNLRKVINESIRHCSYENWKDDFNKALETLLNQYVEAFNKEHNIGNEINYPNGESFMSRMDYNRQTGYPSLRRTHYDENQLKN